MTFFYIDFFSSEKVFKILLQVLSISIFIFLSFINNFTILINKHYARKTNHTVIIVEIRLVFHLEVLNLCPSFFFNEFFVFLVKFFEEVGAHSNYSYFITPFLLFFLKNLFIISHRFLYFSSLKISREINKPYLTFLMLKADCSCLIIKWS